MAVTSAQVCTTHRSHEPAPTYTELHHVIPQAWQASWQPPEPWPNGGPSPDRRIGNPPVPFLLFDARTVPLCRTGHGNVHHWLVLLMRKYAELRHLGQAEHEVRQDAHAAGAHLATADYLIACQAAARWLEAGGSLDQLVTAGLWGEI